MSMKIEDGAARLSLLQLTQWEVWIGRFFDGRPYFDVFARERLMVHLRTYHPKDDVVPALPDLLLSALLQRMIDGRLADFDADLHGRLYGPGTPMPEEEEASELQQTLMPVSYTHLRAHET